jgi:hypothetical protein
VVGPGSSSAGPLARAGRQVVKRAPYKAVYQQRDPRTGDKLGRPRGSYAKFADNAPRVLRLSYCPISLLQGSRRQYLKSRNDSIGCGF